MKSSRHTILTRLAAVLFVLAAWPALAVAEIPSDKALQQAVISNETLQDAAEAGFEVGTRTIVDVLDAQRELLRARRDYARSRYDYLLDSLRLKQSAGILSEEDLVMINALLQEDSVTTDPLQTRPFKP